MPKLQFMARRCDAGRDKRGDGWSVLDVDAARLDSDTESEAATSRTTSRTTSPAPAGMDMDMGGAGQGRQVSEDRVLQSASRSGSPGGQEAVPQSSS